MVKSGVCALGLFFKKLYGIVFQSSFQKLILFIMVIWKLSQAYEYLGNEAYVILHNFNYHFVYMNYRDSFFFKNKKSVGGLKRFPHRNTAHKHNFRISFVELKCSYFIHIHFCLFCPIYLFLWCQVWCLCPRTLFLKNCSVS